MKKLFLDKTFISLISLFLFGIIFGIVFFFLIDIDDKAIIKTGINEYLSLLNNGVSLTSNHFINIFLYYFIIVNIIYISSFIFVLLPIIYFINFYKGFIMGFTLSSFVITFKLKGMLYGFITLFPHDILFIIFLLLFSLLMIKNSKKLILLFKEDKSIKIKNFYIKSSILYFICVIIISIISLSELFINSYLIKVLL